MRKMYEGPAISALYGQLVRDFGGAEAAAAFLNCSKGTVSKEMAGHCSVSPAHFCALEDELGRWPITEMLHSRIAPEKRGGEIALLARAAVKEVGDVPFAVLELLNGGDGQATVKEAREAHEALGRLLEAMEATA